MATRHEAARRVQLRRHRFSLTAAEVEKIFDACLCRCTLGSPMGLNVQGITHSYRLCAPEVEYHKAIIGRMLEELPDEFRATEGGGWSFLNADVDRHGRQWTGFHRFMEMLILLGIATDQAAWLTPREIWPTLPSGMPYVVVYVRC